MAQSRIESYKLFDVLCTKLKNRIPFAFSRWGDGEWFTVAKRQGHNCDGNIYYPELGDRLHEIVSVKQDYYMGKQNVGLFSLADKYTQDWKEADVFHWASIDSKFQPWIDLLYKVPVIYVGNADLKKLPFIDLFIEIPQKNVWNIYADILEQITQALLFKHSVVCFSAGMAANVFVHDLWEYSKEHTYIDVGSVFDPYIGKHTRTYHRNLKVTPL